MQLAFGVKAFACTAFAAIVRCDRSVVVSSLGSRRFRLALRRQNVKKGADVALNAAPNSNDNSMLMTLTLCQSTSSQHQLETLRQHRLLGSLTCLVVRVDWQFGVLLK